MKKILFVHPSNELYGADKVLVAIIESLPKEYSAEVWLPMDVRYPADGLRKELLARGIKVSFVDLPVMRRAYMNWRGMISLLPRLYRTIKFLRASEFDLLYVNTTALALLVPAARILGNPVLVHLHEYLSGITKLVINPLLLFASRVLCVSHAVSAVLPAKVRSRSTVIYNGFDVQQRPMPSDDKKLVFLLASRWNAWKGHKTVLDAWDNLQRTDAVLHIYGAPPEIGEAVDVVGIVAEMANSDSVVIHGQVDNINDALENCDVVLVPSLTPDPLPTIAIEAIGVGRAVIASDCGGLPEIIADGTTGWLLDPRSVDAWTQRLSTLSRAELHVAGERARARYEELFHKERFSADIRSLIAASIR